VSVYVLGVSDEQENVDKLTIGKTIKESATNVIKCSRTFKF
jgi:hypothetical protein